MVMVKIETVMKHALRVQVKEEAQDKRHAPHVDGQHLLSVHQIIQIIIIL
jgi:hypothetical protein